MRKMQKQQEKIKKKPSLAIISSYNELCGNASYTQALKENLDDYFQVGVIGLKTNSPPYQSGAIGDNHIKDICEQIKQYDMVNIQFEAGLYGNNSKDIIKRFKMLSKASKNLIVTLHRLDINTPLSLLSVARKIISSGILSAIKYIYRSCFSYGLVYKEILSVLKQRCASKPFHIIVHTQREANFLKELFNFAPSTFTDYPLIYFSNEKRELYSKQYDSKTWRTKWGIPQELTILGIFGLFGKYKGHETAIKALHHLPDNYGLVIVGGQHPMSISSHGMDPATENILSLLTDNPSEKYFTISQQKNLLNRIFFLGPQNKDEEMIEAMVATDYILLPYLEVGQSASGIASMVLELEKKTLLTRNHCFMELNKYYKDCFETFDIGNFLEAKHKILNFNSEKLENLKNTTKKITSKGLADIYISSLLKSPNREPE